MTPIQLLASQLNELYKWACDIDSKRQAGKPQDWFESGLFSCHSPDLADYVADARRNLARLSADRPALSAASRQRLAEHVAAQVNALTRAFSNQQTRSKFQSTVKISHERAQKSLPGKAPATNLYQQLAEFQQFERRLLDMIEQAERYDNQNANRILALHGRLGRCRKAITEVEQAILLHERQVP
ncbi:primosomal replication protein PriC [Arsukibacterium indicum]|uniref:Primosomal replication protein n=1 Tax=Arsukibacterium indicum TaxID=2848612 RepID=A0ABS6MH30_9GAMM|nr:primosomal replication protein PriC [Arsukibacterium indicum]MBV2128128.1 primosomal replication protein [Arsukibacterium indicum]